MNPYRPDKIDLHTEFIKEVARGNHPPPIRVQLVLSDLCNQDCSFCAYRMEGYSSNEMFFQRDELDNIVSRNPKRLLTAEKALEVVRDCKEMGVKAIELTGGGEPTVHPHLDDVIRLTKESGMDVGLVTNGVRLKPSTIALMAQRGVESWIRISIDAGTPETYSRIRRVSPSHWDQVWRNVALAAEMRRSVADSPLVLGVSFILTKDNWREVKLAAEIARDAGVDSFRVAPIFQNEGDAYFAQFSQEARQCCDEAKSLATEKFTVHSQLMKRIGELTAGSPTESNCLYQRAATYIGADMNVYRCCVNAYNELGKLGSIANQSFRQVWERVGHENPLSSFDATQCSFCPFSDRQQAISNALDRVKHGSFV